MNSSFLLRLRLTTGMNRVGRPARALFVTRYGTRCVAAGRRAIRLLHTCVAASRRPTTYNRAEPVREPLLGFHLVNAPGVPVDTLERVPQRRGSKIESSWYAEWQTL